MISLHVITQNRAADILKLIDIVKPYVDKIRVCDGGSDDNTKAICKAYDIEYYYRKWDENYAAQDNFLLSKASRDEWILLQDDDEIPSIALLEHLPELTYGLHNTVRIPCLPYIDGHLMESVTDFIQHTQEGRERFYKDWLFKNIKGTQMSGTPHRGFVNNGWKSIDTVYPYLHIKTTDGFIVNDCIHGYINPEGQGYTIPEGQELIDHCKANGIKKSKDIIPRLMEGNFTKDFMTWIINHADENDRAICKWFWVYFYIYHPSKLFQYTEKRNWLQKKSLARFLYMKRGYSGGDIMGMSLNPLIMQMLLNEGIYHCSDLGIN